jgi:hypothetical protein
MSERDREHVRLCRERQAAGMIKLTAWANEADFVEVLRRAGWIAPDASDPEYRELLALFQHVVDLWLEPPPLA